MSLKLTVGPVKIIIATILILGGFLFTRIAKGKVQQMPGGSNIIRVGDTITILRFIGFLIILAIIGFLLPYLNKKIKERKRHGIKLKISH